MKGLKILGSRQELSFAYPCNNYLYSLLKIPLVSRTVDIFAERYCKKFLQSIRANEYPITENSYPHCYRVVAHCCAKLDIDTPPEVYISSGLKGINALSIGTDKDNVLILSLKSIIELTDGELKFLVGHELGHIAQKNMICHMIVGMLDGFTKTSDFMGTMFSEIMEIPLKEWARASEYTADRAGLMCCGGIDNVYSLFSRFQKMGSKSLAPRYMELFKDHPTIDNRLKMIYSYYISLSIIENE